MKWIKRILILLALLAILALALPFVIPLKHFIPQVESTFAETIHEPVSIGSLRLMLLPRPGVEIGGIKIGKFHDAQAERISIGIELTSLAKNVKVIPEIDIESATINQDALASMPDWFKSDGSPPKAIVKRVKLHNTSLNFKALRLAALNADIDLGEQGHFAQALIEYPDKSAKLLVKPMEREYTLELEAQKWKPPAGPAMLYDRLHISAVVDGKRLHMQKIDAELYGGTAQGNTQLSWYNGWRLHGNLNSKGVEIHQLVSMLSPETNVGGRLDSQTRFDLRGKTGGRLLESPSVESDFNLKQGILYNFDLAGAMKSLSKEGTRGGQTRFDEFTGHLQIAGKTYHLQNLKIASGVLGAQGNLDILPNKGLKGHISAEMKGTASLISMPLQISGSIKDPVLRPTAGAMTGAVAGTAVLGPLGTSLGAKAGDFVEKIFK